MKISPLKTLFGIAVILIFFSRTSSAQVQHHIAAANILVVQNDASNTTESVTVSTTLSINDFRIRNGSNRGDYNVQMGAVSTDDVPNGILMGSINQNGRDNGELDNFPGKNYGTCSIDSNAGGSPGSSGEYWFALFQAPQNAEYNFNVAGAWFPYSDGWYGGWLNNANGSNGGANNHLIGTPGLVLGTHVADQGSGKTKVDLRSFGLDSRSNAVLLVEGGKNEANFAVSATNTDGTWTITCRDNNGGAEQDYVGFVCIPLTNHTVVSGRFMGNAQIALQSESYQVANTGVGTYHLSIPGVNPASGVLIVSGESGGTYNGDNMVNYQINGDGWDIQTRDINKGYTPALQTLPNTDAVASFVFIPGPVPGSTALRWSGGVSTNWDFSASQNWRIVSNNALTNYSDSCQTIFDNSASNFVVNLTASVSPYQTVVSNSVNYSIRGAGSIIGSGGLTKQGTGKLTLAMTNHYTGDTIISQGTVALNAKGCIPSGAGFGDVIVNGTLDMGGFDGMINNLSGNGTVDNATAGGAPTLEIFQTKNTTFSGTIKNTTGSLALTLNGGNILTLGGANTLSGGCTISNGTLAVNGSLGTGIVAVQSAGALAGTGTINGAVTMAAGSSLKLTGNTPLTTGPITLNGIVTVHIASGVAQTNAATYVLLNHGAVSGSGSFKIVLPPGLQASGFKASLVDTGTQLQMVVAASGVTGTIADVRHVILYMNENRSLDHYFGTLHGVRGFDDRNVLQMTNGQNVFYQPSNSTYELPFHNSIQCLTDLNHSWSVTHATVNKGRNDGWIPNKGAETMCYFDRNDLPYYYALADAFTICDEYHCSVLASTDPNRFTYMTGMIDPNGTGGGPEIDNSSVPTGFTWKTYPEFLQDAGVSWKVYSVSGNNSENILNRFAAYKQSTPGTPLYDRARASYPSQAAMVNSFSNDVANGNLPLVTWIVGTSEYCEHPPHSSANGEVLLKQLLDALGANPEVYKSSVFIFNYDENDGFYDHAMPILPPAGTADEFVGSEPIGLGIRVPAIIVSPWSRGGRVCSQVFDHTSTIRFLETFTGVTNSNISAWRRQVCGDMTSAFDFAHPNLDYPIIPGVDEINCGDGITPDVPSPQIVPMQESGSLVSLPLPYQPDASCTLNSAANTFAITMTNSGSASVHFGIYPNAFRSDDPQQFDVAITNSATTTFSTAGTAGKYDFSCYGPNGFQRRFAGVVSADFQKIEATSILNPVNGALQIALKNLSGSSVTFAVTNGYRVSGLANYVLPAHTTNVINVGSETNNGLYDITVTASADSSFVRRFLGRVEAFTPPNVFGSEIFLNGAFQFSFNGPEGQPYRILAATNLTETINWSVVGSGNFESQPSIYSETNFLNAARFYRVVSP